MHIWDTFVSHCTQTDVMRFLFFADACKSAQDNKRRYYYDNQNKTTD